jgi:restriction system protein
VAIPDFQTCMLPFLRFLGDGQERTLKEVQGAIAAELRLSEPDLNELLPSGGQTVFRSRVGWARTYLKRAELIHSPERGRFQITKRGLELLEDAPERITRKYLHKYREFYEWSKQPREEPEELEAIAPSDGRTPRETLEAAYQQLRAELAAEIAHALQSADPAKFERIVVELLVRMGYGGNLVDAGRAIGRSGDEGIDGVIKEDHLGLDNIYVQAKKWESTVGRPEIQKFAGALQGQRARKGVFIATSEFSREAREFVQRIDAKIVLIDGKSLCELMIDFNVGVNPTERFELKRIDLDFFSED